MGGGGVGATADQSSATRRLRAHACAQPCTARTGTAATVFPAICERPRAPSDAPRRPRYSRRSGPLGGPFSIRRRRPASREEPLAPAATPPTSPTSGSASRRAATRGHRATFEIWLAPLRPVELDGDALVRRARPRELARLGRQRFGARCSRRAVAVLGAGARRARRRRPAPAARRRKAAVAPSRPPRAGADRAEPEVHLRPVRHRRRQPLRPRGGPRRGGAARPGLQPAVHLRAARRRQDAPPALDRQLRRGLRRRPDRPLHDGRALHERVHRRAHASVVGALQGPLPRQRRPPHRRRPVPRRKVKTEEEFFHTFNALYETGSQLVLTCDRLPRDLDALEDRLRERFESGLVADIRAPDLPRA